MSVNNSNNSQVFRGNGSTTTFSFGFILGNPAWAYVVYTDPDGVSVTLTPADYALSLNAPSVGQAWGIGGTVTYAPGNNPIPDGSTLLVLRAVPYVQQTSFIAQGNFNPQVLEQALDYEMFALEQLAAQVAGLDGQTAAIQIPFGVDVGATDAYSVTSTNPAIPSFGSGTAVLVQFTHANTGASTLNIAATGDFPLVHIDGSALNFGDIAVNGIGLVVLQSSNWQLLSVFSTSAGSVTSVTGSHGVTASPTTGAVGVSLSPILSPHLLANTSGGSAAPSDTSLSTLLDAAVGSGLGALITRNAGGWQSLTPGPSGDVLTSTGTSAPLAWASGGAPFVFLEPSGGDDTAAINAALAANAFLFLSPGNFSISSAIVMAQTDAALIGSGLSTTTITLTNGTADAIAVTSVNFVISGFTLTRSATSTTIAAGINVNTTAGQGTISQVLSQNHGDGFLLGSLNYGTVRECTAQFNFGHGFHLKNVSTAPLLQWNMNTCLAQGNNGWGFYTESNGLAAQATCLPWINCQTYANTNGGIGFVDNAATPISDITLIGCLCGSDGYDIIHIDVHGENVRIQDSYVELAGIGASPSTPTTGRGYATLPSGAGNGIFIGANTKLVQITGSAAQHNSYNGIIVHSADVSIVGTVCSNNGASTPAGFYGIDLHDANIHAMVAGCKSANNGGVGQNYGIHVQDGTYTSLVGNDCTDNTGGAVLVTTNGSLVQSWGTQGFANNPAGGGAGTVIFDSTISIASATTCDLGTKASNLIAITGNTNISSFGSSASTGNARYIVYFVSAGGQIIGGSGITTQGSISPITWAAGDAIVLRYVGSGNWTVEDYVKANGTAFQNPLFTSSTAGTVTASGGGTTNFLRADGAWAVPITSAGNVVFDSTVSIASATTCNLGSVASNLISVTGITGITSFGSSASVSNALYWIYFASSGGTVTGGANITTPSNISPITWAAGDLWSLRYVGAGVWNVQAIFKANGQAFQNPVFGSGAAGIVPASGGGTTNFLRADGTWQVPAAGGAVSSVTGASGVTVSPTTGATVASLTAIANNTVLGNTSGGSAVPTAQSASSILGLLGFLASTGTTGRLVVQNTSSAIIFAWGTVSVTTPGTAASASFVAPMPTGTLVTMLTAAPFAASYYPIVTLVSQNASGISVDANLATTVGYLAVGK